MKVDFMAVGRDRKTWSAEYEQGADFERWATSQIREKQALRSRNLEFAPTNGDEPGVERLVILAGVRSVGCIAIHTGGAP